MADLSCSGCGRSLPNPEQWPVEHFSGACDACKIFVRPSLYPGQAEAWWRTLAKNVAWTRKALPPTAAMELRVHPLALVYLLREHQEAVGRAPDGETWLFCGVPIAEDDGLEAATAYWLCLRWPTT